MAVEDHERTAPAFLREVQIGERVMTGAGAVLSYLAVEGTDVVFGSPGDSNNPLITSPYRGNIRFFRPPHEGGHAAEGYARMSGKVGVMMVIGGPGTTDLMTPLANAFADSTSIIGIIGSGLPGKRFQKLNIKGMTTGAERAVKEAFQISHPGAVPEIMQQAFFCSRSGCPGPVVVEITKDVQLATDTFRPFYPDTTPVYPVNTSMDIWKFERAAEMIDQADKLVILVGQGALISPNAPGILYKVAEKSDAFVTNTLHGKSVFPDTHPSNAGMIGYQGTYIANRLLEEVDCVLVVGAHLDEKATKGLGGNIAPQADLIQIDTDPTQCAQLTRPDQKQISIAADAAFALGEIFARTHLKQHPEWRARFEKLIQQARTTRLSSFVSKVLTPSEVIYLLSQTTQGQAVVVGDAGQSKFAAALYYDAELPKSFMVPGGFGAMGFSLSAAVGAKIAAPDRDVYAVTGDGSTLRASNAWSLEKGYQIPVCHIIMNNNSLGSVAVLQEKSGDGPVREVDQTDLNPDFLMLGQAFGIPGIRVTRAEEVIPALLEAQKNIRAGRSYIIEAQVGILRA